MKFTVINNIISNLEFWIFCKPLKESKSKKGMMMKMYLFYLWAEKDQKRIVQIVKTSNILYFCDSNTYSNFSFSSYFFFIDDSVYDGFHNVKME